MADKQIDEKLLRKYYMHTFTGEAGAIVLKDLENRCFKRSSTVPVPGMPSVGETIEINEGKRQMLLHIENMMSPEGIAKLDESPEGGSNV